MKIIKSSYNIQLWKPLLKTWFPLLKNFETNKYYESLINFINIQYQYNTVFPEKKDIFKTFKITDYNNLKVVIVGQEPYCNGKATGLAFANKENIGDIKASPSLIKIEGAVERSKNKFYIGLDYSLKKWADQGVLLLNSSLTVIKNEPKSHLIYWKYFIKNILKEIDQNNSGIIFCFWGQTAKGFKNYINEKKNYILECEDPSFAVKTKTDWKCNHFNIINNYIKDINGIDEIINW